MLFTFHSSSSGITKCLLMTLISLLVGRQASIRWWWWWWWEGQSTESERGLWSVKEQATCWDESWAYQNAFWHLRQGPHSVLHAECCFCYGPFYGKLLPRAVAWLRRLSSGSELRWWCNILPTHAPRASAAFTVKERMREWGREWSESDGLFRLLG